MKIGYARVSTEDQSLSLQLDALEAEGCALPVFRDVASGVRADRRGLAAAIEACGPGDVLTVWKLDRLGRSLLELVKLAERLREREVDLKVLTGVGAAIDTTKAEGRLFFSLFAALAEFERELIRERTLAGMAAAKRRGRHVGRPRKLTPENLATAATLLKDRSHDEVARTLGVAVSTLRDGLKQKPLETRLLPKEGLVLSQQRRVGRSQKAR